MGKRLVIIILACTQIYFDAFPIEGMWIPLLLDSLNIKDMQEKGLKLTPEDIYSVNHGSLKDAVVIFGGGCTGEVISPDGLLITNHHCGYSRIQSHSDVENNLLEKGFWAADRSKELPNPGLTATFLIRIEDVTQAVLEGTTDATPEGKRSNAIAANAVRIVDEATESTHYEAEVVSFYFGKQYFLFVYEIFKDVRLVGAPPEAIGRFGGDTDNWIWPRHTGDFSLFRIYAGKDNKPAAYSPDNVPYHPRHYLPISMKGIKEGDFTMVIGYPGSTNEYLLSSEIRMLTETCLPAKIQMRTLKLTALEKEMNKSAEAKLKYASEYVSISNAWKKWIGVIRGIDHTGTINKKIRFEEQFEQWVSVHGDGKAYEEIMTQFSNFYDHYEPLFVANDLGIELLNGIDLFNLISNTLVSVYYVQDSSRADRKAISEQLIDATRNYYHANLPLETDLEILPDYLKIYYDNTVPAFHPDFYLTVTNDYHGDYHKYIDHIYSKSLFADTVRLFRLFKKDPDVIMERMLDDPLHRLYYEFNRTLADKVFLQLDNLEQEKNQLYRAYLNGLMEMDTSRQFYPDANFTMRITYGKVEGYQPADAVDYAYYTTLDGVIEKENPDIEDYFVPESLKNLYFSGDYGRFIEGNQVPVCFIASNHTSGGNSGSPVLNAEGQLIGINFDRNWEGTMSDYAYNPEVCRNISLDIRYVLFILDRLANAHHILNEITVVE